MQHATPERTREPACFFNVISYKKLIVIAIKGFFWPVNMLKILNLPSLDTLSYKVHFHQEGIMIKVLVTCLVEAVGCYLSRKYFSTVVYIMKFYKTVLCTSLFTVTIASNATRYSCLNTLLFIPFFMQIYASLTNQTSNLYALTVECLIEGICQCPGVVMTV